MYGLEIIFCTWWFSLSKNHGSPVFATFYEKKCEAFQTQARVIAVVQEKYGVRKPGSFGGKFGHGDKLGFGGKFCHDTVGGKSQEAGADTGLGVQR